MSIEFIKQAEDSLVKLWGDPNSIVADKNNCLSLLVFQAANLDTGRLGSRILCGIIDQILHDLHEPNAITVHDRKIFLYSNFNLFCLQLSPDSFHGFLNDLIKWSPRRRIHDTGDPG